MEDLVYTWQECRWLQLCCFLPVHVSTWPMCKWSTTLSNPGIIKLTCVCVCVYVCVCICVRVYMCACVYMCEREA